MTRINRQWRLKRRPVGDIQDGDLEFAQAPVPDIADGQALVRNIYLSLDPTNRIWMSDVDGYLPPVEIGAVMRGGTIGVVEESRNPEFPVGAIVSPGLSGWQDYDIAMPGMARVLPVIPGIPITAFMSVLGVTGWTAYFGLLDIGKPQPGETLVVSAAAGAVGSIVGQIGKIKGCRVIGIAGSDDKCRWITQDLGFDGAINYKTQNVGAELDRLCPKGIDINFENVGGAIMDQVLARMNNFSRMPLCGLISGYNATKAIPGPYQFPNILMRRITVRGFIVLDYFARAPEAVAEMAGWLREGKLHYKVHIDRGLENAPVSVKRLFSGDHDGKLLVQISDDPTSA